jgi:hypothetical protein
MFTYNYLGLSSYTVAVKSVIKGKNNIVLDFTWDGPKPGAGGLARIFVNNQLVAQGRIDKTQGYIFSADETADVGVDDATHVADYGHDSRFTGSIDKIVLQLKPQGPGINKAQEDSVKSEEEQRKYLEE